MTLPPPVIADADWYDQPAFQTTQLTTLAAYSQRIVAEDKSLCPSYNYSYTMSFHAPRYNCSKVTFSDLPADQFSLDAFVSHSPLLAEDGENLIYKAQIFANHTEYKMPYPGYDWKAYSSQGTFRGDPDVYLEFVVFATNPLPNITGTTRGNLTLDPQAWRCEHQKVKFTVPSE
ncbi:hypothetical protein BDD12DRAFT_893518 [Trichophaea hybrida]|nr:hypothetical protein BDD12DRAFT_893518 [Trichophaea hybrida]